MSSPRIALLNVEVKVLDADFRTLACPRCGSEAPRHSSATRYAQDLGLDHPLVLQIKVGIYRCPSCREPQFFRTPLDFLAPHGRYVQRCHEKLIQSIDLDQTPICLAVKRLARDFGVKIAGSTGYLWYRKSRPSEAELNDYGHLVAESFSGVLCVDEVYDGGYGILAACDPLSGKTVAYELNKGIDQQVIIEFFQRLKRLGINPEVVITDGSPMYPKAIQEVWQDCLHQLCRFHWTKDVLDDVLDGVKEYRRSLPKPPRLKRGRPKATDVVSRQQAQATKAAHEAVRKERGLLVKREKNLDAKDTAALQELIKNHPPLGIIRQFMSAFYGIFQAKPEPDEARTRWRLIINNKEYHDCPYLQKPLKIVNNEANFEKVILYLQFENLDSTSNEVERDNRGFRKRQKLHYRIRKKDQIQALLDRRLIRNKSKIATIKLLRREVS